MHTDGTRSPVDLRELFAGAVRTGCWIIGGGPSLASLPCASIAASPSPKFGINLAGSGLLRPTLWTSYDPSCRFHRSVYLDASILKFVHARRAMDLAPETTFKVCECPGTLFFERDPQRGFADLLSPAHTGIIDWNDSLLQAIDIAYRLGFRVLYLAGCDMFVAPSAGQMACARRQGIEYIEREPLDRFFGRCAEAGVDRSELERAGAPPQYHFDEVKPLSAAIQTDLHYFRVAQYLRLARRSIALAGVELISATPNSRLNDYIPYRSADSILKQLAEDVGTPQSEPTRGRYTALAPRSPAGLGAMKDYRPHHWGKGHIPEVRPAAADRHPSDPAAPRERLRAAVEQLPEIHVNLAEQG